MCLFNSEYLGSYVALCSEGISTESNCPQQLKDELFKDLLVPYIRAFNDLTYVEVMF